jgi:hypothetical protein
MKAKQGIRNERIKQTQELYKLIIVDNENAKEDLYKIIKDVIKDNISEIASEAEDFIYQQLEKNLSTTLGELRKIYGKSFKEKEVLDIKDALYEDDGKNLFQRIEDWINGIIDEDENKPEPNDVLILFYHLCLIMDNETFRTIAYAIKNKVNSDYVEIISGEGCDICSEYADGNVYKEDEMELPPYHPSCQCIPIYYKKDEVLGDIE